jgi:hypothetical protein
MIGRQWREQATQKERNRLEGGALNRMYSAPLRDFTAPAGGRLSKIRHLFERAHSESGTPRR